MIIVGKGAHARQCAEILSDKEQRRGIGFWDEHELPFLISGYFIIGFGSLSDPQKRQDVFDRLEDAGGKPKTIIHPFAYVSPNARLGMGVQIHAGAIVHNNAVIGTNCIINTGAIVSHDCKLGKNVHLTPGATLAGNVEIGDNSVIGMNATIYMGVQLPSNTRVLNGRNVKACKDGKLYYIL